MENFDVIIIGGSVAGSTTGMLLARRGHKVLLIERHKFPRDTLSTHFIWPRGVSYLTRWGLADKILKSTPHFTRMEVGIEGISLAGSIPVDDMAARFRDLHGDDQGVTNTYCGPRRYFLDQVLLDAAKDAGVDVREGVSFTRTITAEGVVKGIEAVTGEGTLFRVHAPLVIGADGRFSNFAKQVGSETIDFRRLSTFAYFGYFSGIDKEELAIHKRGRLGTAIFPTSDGTHMVLVYGPTAWWGDFRADAEGNFFKTYEFCAPDVAALVRGGRREEPFKACGAMPAFKRDLHGPGWALIGDAGSFKDQVTAMGITHAFRDSELITGFIHQALSGEVLMAQALATYAQVRERDYAAYFDLVCSVAEMNAYKRADLEHFYAMRNDQQQIDQFLSQFGDTRPLTPAGSPAVVTQDLPHFIQNFDRTALSYESRFYESAQRLSVPAVA